LLQEEAVLIGSHTLMRQGVGGDAALGSTGKVEEHLHVPRTIGKIIVAADLIDAMLQAVEALRVNNTRRYRTSCIFRSCGPCCIALRIAVSR
jgi:hypothetical protein